jgi:DnaJ family protein C protein 2
LYAMLGLPPNSFECSDAQVGKAYRNCALIFHPDKLGENLTEKDKEVWLKIQSAYDILIDPTKKKKYDSSMPFDDDLPKMSDISNDKEFYEKFGKCFTNNARFSTIKPVPCIGDAKTPISDVKKFYLFWDSFKTWREFSQYDEYNTEEAQDRYEKRWMEKQNKSGRSELEKEERKRIFTLTNRGYDNDPRVKNMLAAEEVERQAAKQAKKDRKTNKYVNVKCNKEEEAKLAKIAAEEALLVKKAEQKAK